MEVLVTGVMLLVLYVALRKDIKAKPQSTTRSRPSKAKEPKVERVYVIGNSSFKSGIFKIGLTTREVDTRIKELRTTGVPDVFEKCIILKTDDCKKLESDLHQRFSAKRRDPRREFFNLDREDLDTILRIYAPNIVLHDPEAISRALGAPVPIDIG